MNLTISNRDAFTKYFVAVLVRAMKDEASQLPDLMTALVLENMHDGRNPNPNARNTTDRVYERQGGLKRSLVPGGRGNTTKVTAGTNGINFEFSVNTVVASVHEHGATIPITPQMRKFFWAKYAETSADMWRALALTKKASITIPPRPFFSKAIKELESVELPEIVEQIFQRMSAYLQ